MCCNIVIEIRNQISNYRHARTKKNAPRQVINTRHICVDRYGFWPRYIWCDARLCFWYKCIYSVSILNQSIHHAPFSIKRYIVPYVVQHIAYSHMIIYAWKTLIQSNHSQLTSPVLLTNNEYTTCFGCVRRGRGRRYIYIYGTRGFFLLVSFYILYT